MRATAILVRWQDGWKLVDGSGDHRIEMCQGHAGDSEEIVFKATAELATYDDGQTEITVGLAPEDPSATPQFGNTLIEGDEVFVDGAWREIEAYTAAIDDDTGLVTIVPQFGVVLDGPVQRIDRVIGSIGGLAAGTSKTSRPTSDVPDPDVRPSQ